MLALLVALALSPRLATGQVATTVPPAQGSASTADTGGQAVEALIEAAQAEGLRVVVIEPGDASPDPVAEDARELSISGLVGTFGTVAKRAGQLLAETREPDWPRPSTEPLKPVTNGALVVLGLLAGSLLVRRYGLHFHPFATDIADTPMPVRVLRGLIGIAICAVIAMIGPFVVYGTGSKTLELVGIIVEAFASAAFIVLCSGALLERLQRDNPKAAAVAEAPILAANIQIALLAVMGYIAVGATTAFAYPEAGLIALIRLLALMLTLGLGTWISYRHRAALGLLAAGMARGPVPWLERNAWRIVPPVLVVGLCVAAGSVLLERDDALGIILAPVLAGLAGLVTYHVVVFVLTALFGRLGGSAALAGPHAATAPVVSIAKAAGTVVALLWFLGRMGLVTLGEGAVGTFLLTASLVLIVAQGLWSFTAVAIDQRLALEMGADADHGAAESEGEGGVGLSRIATLLPLLRRTAWVVIWAIALLMLLYEAGVNITPVFASAGVVGLAIGFGAQSLVRDIISGLFFLVDDAFRMGEYIETGGLKGTVERISIRSMQLRHHNGPLNTIPFGNINDLTNYSRDWVIMKLPVKLTLDTDPERVRKLVKKLGVALLDDPLVGKKFLDPLKSQGVLSIDNWGMTMRVKFKTRPGDQFVTRRVVYAKLHEMFEREGIEFANRDVRVRLAEAKEAAMLAAPPAAATVAAMAMQDAEGAADDPTGAEVAPADER
ncbi:MAG: mechanosensitive ion channel family protein [Pseudomonadota bacterium]